MEKCTLVSSKFIQDNIYRTKFCQNRPGLVEDMTKNIFVCFCWFAVYIGNLWLIHSQFQWIDILLVLFSCDRSKPMFAYWHKNETVWIHSTVRWLLTNWYTA